MGHGRRIATGPNEWRQMLRALGRFVVASAVCSLLFAAIWVALVGLDIGFGVIQALGAAALFLVFLGVTLCCDGGDGRVSPLRRSVTAGLSVLFVAGIGQLTKYVTVIPAAIQSCFQVTSVVLLVIALGAEAGAVFRSRAQARSRALAAAAVLVGAGLAGYGLLELLGAPDVGAVEVIVVALGVMAPAMLASWYLTSALMKGD